MKGLRIGWTPDFGSAPVDPEVRAACEAAARSFEALGAHVEDADINIDYEDAFDTMDTIMFSDRAANNGVHLEENADLLDDTLRPLLEEGMKWSARKLAFALRRFEWHRYNFARIFDNYDLLLSPVMATPAFTIGEASAGNRRAASDERVLGVQPVQLPDKHERSDGGQHPLRLQRGRTSHRPAHDRRQGPGSAGAASVGGLRRSPPLGTQTPPGFLGGRQTGECLFHPWIEDFPELGQSFKHPNPRLALLLFRIVD